MSLRFDCPACDASLQADAAQTGARGRCPGCRRPVIVPAPPPDLEARLGQLRQLYDEHLDIFRPPPWPAGLTRCAGCGRTGYGVLGRCACGALEVDTDPWLAGTGASRKLARAGARHARLRELGKRLLWAEGTALACYALWYMAGTGPLSWLFFLPLQLALGALLPLASLAGLRRLLDHVGRAGAVVRAPGRARTLFEDFLAPFFTRHPGPVSALSAEPRRLLGALLEERGYGEAWAAEEALLVSGRLRYEAREVAVALGAYARDDSLDGLLEGWVLLADEETRPRAFLEAALADRGLAAPDDLDARLCAIRQRFALDRFAAGLEAARGAEELLPVTLERVDRMDPYDFELLVALLFEVNGYHAETTPKSGDQGADVILRRDGRSTAVQVKLYAGKVGNKAVQEALSGRAFWACDAAMLVTNSTPTGPARSLAARADVEIVARDRLGELLVALNRSPRGRLRGSRLLRGAAPLEGPRANARRGGP